jgi:hypothetical protein
VSAQALVEPVEMSEQLRAPELPGAAEKRGIQDIESGDVVRRLTG